MAATLAEGRLACKIFCSSTPPLMPYTDPIVLGLILVSLVASLVYQWQRGLRWRLLAVTVFAMFFSFTVIAAMTMHCADVLWGLTHHLPSMSGKPFAYDWRTYSLLLFGALMIWLGARCLEAALRMGRGDERGRSDFLRRVALALVIVLPIIPVHPFFGPLASIASTLALLVVGLGGRVRSGLAHRSTVPDSRVGP
jgi:hypothetical protein